MNAVTALPGTVDAEVTAGVLGFADSLAMAMYTSLSHSKNKIVQRILIEISVLCYLPFLRTSIIFDNFGLSIILSTK